jgi:hypothetical protein
MGNGVLCWNQRIRKKEASNPIKAPASYITPLSSIPSQHCRGTLPVTRIVNKGIRVDCKFEQEKTSHQMCDSLVQIMKLQGWRTLKCKTRVE